MEKGPDLDGLPACEYEWLRRASGECSDLAGWAQRVSSVRTIDIRIVLTVAHL